MSKNAVYLSELIFFKLKDIRTFVHLFPFPSISRGKAYKDKSKCAKLFFKK